MAELHDPALPPGEIISKHRPDGAVRNDGKKLSRSSRNQWYVLATIAGEQGEAISSELHKKNRRFWNGWMCQEMPPNDRFALAGKLGVNRNEMEPLSDDETRILEKKFSNLLKHTEIPRPDKNIDLSGLNFQSAVSFSGFAFVSNVSFVASNFSGPAEFQHASFHKKIDFQDAHFSNYADLQSVDFLGYAHFDRAYFTEHADFFKSQFAKRAYFSSACFSQDLDFQEARFSAVCYFKYARFGGAAHFDNAHFCGPVNFFNVQFDGVAFFYNARFNGPARFDAACFTDLADFRVAEFAREAHFPDGALRAKTVFTEVKFVLNVPEFFHREMHQDTSFTDDPNFWPSATKENAQEGKRAYTRLRQIAADIYDPDLEHFFLRQEMRCKEQIEIGKKDWFHAGMFRLFRWVADYGISVARPFWLMVCVWAFGAGCAAGYFDSGAEAVLSADVQDNRYASAAGVSFGNLFGFLGINRLYFADMLRAAPDGLQFVAGLQTVLGVVLLFFFGLGLRNRFRLK